MTLYDEHSITSFPMGAPTDDYLKLLREHVELKLMYDRLKEIKKPSKQTFRYYGGKWSLAEWIISHFPPHDLYLEPFFGSGGVFFTKMPSAVEVISDLNGEIVHFFKALRTQPDALIRAILLTPYAESEYQSVFDGRLVDDIERARRFYIRLKMSWANSWEKDIFRRDKGGRMKRDNAPNLFSHIAHLYGAANRLKEAQIDCADAIAQIQRYNRPDALVYLDPPYVAETRGQKTRYESEMTDEQHRDLARAAKETPAMVIVSGYPSALYDELYAGWKVVTTQAVDMINKPRTECLWINPTAQQAMKPNWKKQMLALG
jgi:DNA adenine methylase